MKRLEGVAIVGMVALFAWVIGSSMITTRPKLLCTYSGSPYLDQATPNECEDGQLPQFLGTMPPEYVEYYEHPNPSLYAEILAKYLR